MEYFKDLESQRMVFDNIYVSTEKATTCNQPNKEKNDLTIFKSVRTQRLNPMQSGYPEVSWSIEGDETIYNSLDELNKVHNLKLND